jgi:hypothetical protein
MMIVIAHKLAFTTTTSSGNASSTCERREAKPTAIITGSTSISRVNKNLNRTRSAAIAPTKKAPTIPWIQWMELGLKATTTTRKIIKPLSHHGSLDLCLSLIKLDF